MGHILAHSLSQNKSKRSQFIHSRISDYSEINYVSKTAWYYSVLEAMSYQSKKRHKGNLNAYY